MKTEQRPRRGAAVLLSTVLTIVAVGGAVKANLWKQDLRIRRLETRGERIVTAADILNLAGIRKDQRLFSLDLAAVRTRVQQNPFIGSVAVNREVPDRVVITVSERIPIAAIAGERLMYLDPEGVVLPPVRSELTLDLPVVTGTLPTEEFVAGRRVTSQPIAEILALLSTAKAVSGDLYRKISEIHVVQGRDFVVYMADGGATVVFGHDKLADQCVKLEEFWKQFVAARGGSGLDYVDLRFDDQVVVRWRHAAGPAQQ